MLHLQWLWHFHVCHYCSFLCFCLLLLSYPWCYIYYKSFNVFLYPGVEVKSGQSLKIDPGDSRVVHLSQVVLNCLWFYHYSLISFFWAILYGVQIAVCRLLWVSSRRIEEASLYISIWKLVIRSLFSEPFLLRNSLSWVLIWFSKKILNCLIIGRMGVFTSLDIKFIQRQDILFVIPLTCTWELFIPVLFFGLIAEIFMFFASLTTFFSVFTPGDEDVNSGESVPHCFSFNFCVFILFYLKLHVCCCSVTFRLWWRYKQDSTC